MITPLFNYIQYFEGPKIRFGHSCSEGDVCAENNLQCLQGVCTCREGYGKDSTGQICGKCTISCYKLIFYI